MDKSERILIIVESPNKISTLKSIFNDAGIKNIIVMASGGHITKIADTGLYNLGIDVEDNFDINYVLPDDNKKLDNIKKLKEQVKFADKVILATDEDREGEAISWHLKTQLKIPKNKYVRCTFHEITKQAVLKALDNPRMIDDNLVDAAKARQCLDKIIGYRLSTIARNSISAKSVGRCQSAGLKLLVEREEEIQNFKPEKYYDLYLHFKKNTKEFKAKYAGTDKNEVKSLKSRDECEKVGEQCFNKPYIIKNIEKKESLEYPKYPFTTSTFQQEVSKKLGISVEDAMKCAQKLFEGINIGAKHIALCTYLRTDDANIAPEFIPVLESFVKKTYGKDAYAKPRTPKKNENSQEGHECFRIIDPEMTPEKLEQYITDTKLLKIYDIIYKRTIAAAMKPAVLSNTIYSIYNGEHKFIMNSRELLDEGYRKVYSYKEDDAEDEEIVTETFVKDEKLSDTRLKSEEKETTPPKRFNEASFIKELDKKGIGRPSTFATIVQTLEASDRGYTEIKDKCLVPTSKGIELSHFLDEKFPDIINIQYTSDMEKSLDLIAKGKLNNIDFLKAFYKNLKEAINRVKPDVSTDKVCPYCGKPLVMRKNNKGIYFYGCSAYPKCKYTESIKN